MIALQKIYDTGAHGVSVTSDGPSAHLSMMKVLGANLNAENLEPHFPHPSNPNVRVHVLLDIAHMLKLVRNCLASEKVIHSPAGDIQWDYVVKLQHLQEVKGLRAGTKLKRQHIEFERNKMKVSVAAQTLSASVADAIDFLREDLKLADFQGSEATSEFIRIFDKLFDCFNSRSLFGKRFKAPLSSTNHVQWLSVFTEAQSYIKSLTKTDGCLLVSSRQRTGFLGFLIAIHSFQNLFQDLVSNGPLQYLLSYKFSQVNINIEKGYICLFLYITIN